MKYGIFSGCYSDWSVHGYFDEKDDAEKYCATKNEQSGYDSYDRYYVMSIAKLEGDFSKIKLRYYHEVVFDLKTGMRDEPERYEYYTGEERTPKSVYGGYGWFSYSTEAKTRKKAEKIAQDKYYAFLAAYKTHGTYEAAARMVGAVTQ